jgi:tellurite methyltransferase
MGDFSNTRVARGSVRPTHMPRHRATAEVIQSFVVTSQAEHAGERVSESAAESGYALGMERAIIGFHQDDQDVWVAELACGHAQHVRHQPPWQEREWVTREDGRAAQLGTLLECVYCNMAPLPSGLTAYKRTDTFTEQTVPAALTRDHRTKPRVWARIVVEHGKLEYVCARGTFVLKPGVAGIVEPESPHHVRPLEPVRFHVEFLRRVHDEPLPPTEE